MARAFQAGFGGVLTFVLGAVAAVLALGSDLGRWTLPPWTPVAFALVGAGVLVLVVAVAAHAATRRDLARPERLVLVLAVVAVPFGAFAYLGLGAARTAAFARRVADMFDPMPDEHAA